MDRCLHPGVRKAATGYVCSLCGSVLDPAEVGAVPWLADEIAGLPVRGPLAVAVTLPPALVTHLVVERVRPRPT